MNRPFAIALILGAVPLVAGFAVFAAWVVSRWEGWIAAGLAIVGLGTLAVLAGLVALVFAFDRFRGEARLSSAGVAGRMACGAGLLLVNFPAAIAVMLAVIRLEERCVVVLTNDTDEVARGGTLSWPGDAAHVAEWSPGERRRFAFWCAGEGPIELHLTDFGGAPLDVEVESSTGSGLGGRWDVRLVEDGLAEVIWRAH